MERPKTASRPGTAKRPKTAGRNSDRPPTMMERPVSRKAIDRDPHNVHDMGISYEEEAPVLERVASRAGPSAYGNRPLTGARLGTASGRPLTASRMIPPGTGAQRPLTQQGLAGARAVSRAGTAFGSRIIMDKTYFMALLNNSLAATTNEIKVLETELQKYERSQQKLLSYEQRAEEMADEIKELQGSLADYNLVVDRQNTKVEFNEYEYLEEKKKNDELAKTVEDMFRERRDKEDHARTLEAQVEEIRLANEDMINGMDPSIREEYIEVQTRATEVGARLDAAQQTLNTLTQRKDELDVALINNPLKQQAMVLQEQIAELEMRKAEVVAQLNDSSSPEQIRQRLVEQMKKDNEEIAHMQSMIEELNKRVDQTREELMEFQQEFDILYGSNNRKFRELKVKEMQMEEFIKGFDASKAALEREMETSSNEVVRLLQLISINCPKEEDSPAAGGASEQVATVSTDPEELQEMHVRLQEQIIDLDTNESRFNAEYESLVRKRNQIEDSPQESENLVHLQQQLANQRNHLKAECDALDRELPGLEQEVKIARNRVEQINEKMQTNPNFGRLLVKKAALTELVQEKKQLSQQIDVKTAEISYEEHKAQAMRLRKEYNDILVRMYGG